MPVRSSSWHGRSGDVYALEVIPLDLLELDMEHLVVLAEDGLVVWVGSARDVIENHLSRERLRLAMRRGAKAFRTEAPADELARLTLAWDLEGATLERSELSA